MMQIELNYCHLAFNDFFCLTISAKYKIKFGVDFGLTLNEFNLQQSQLNKCLTIKEEIAFTT